MEQTELTPLPMNKLSMKEAVDALFAGKVVIVKQLEETRKLDVLVRLDNRIVPVTQISYDVVPITGDFDSVYWVVYDLPLNVFSTYDVYEYSEENAKLKVAFDIGTSVWYTSVDGVLDTAIVKEIFKDIDNKIWYKLSRETELYPQDELTKEKIYTPS